MPEFNLLYTALMIAGVLAFVMGVVAYLILAERKVAAWVQDRVGPNRVGPWGLLQPLADGGKMFLKEDVIPSHVDKVFFVLAPIVAFSTALLAIAVVPVGPTTPPPGPQLSVAAYAEAQANYQGRFSFVIQPGLDIGLLYVFAIGSLAVYGIILAGWSANNKYSLLGSLRSSAQMISYEIPLGLSIVGVLLFTGSLNLEQVIAWQQERTWFVFAQPLAFLLFLIAVFAETNRLPFDLPEAEQELVGGYHTEYSNSMKLGLMLLAEYAHMITTSFLMAIVFWGGWSFFGLESVSDDPLWATLIRFAILGGKMFCFVFLFLLVRWTIPRFRFDQLMGLAWKVMIPLAIVHLVAAMVVRQFGLPLWVLTLLSIGLFFAAGLIGLRSGGPNNRPRRRARPPEVDMPIADTDVRWVEEPKLGLLGQLYLPIVADGLATTLSHLFTRKVTEEYPEQEPNLPPNYRGVHRLNRDEKGRVKCVACYMCATACPAHCIDIVAAPAPAGWPDREKYPETFVIDELRCIYCGMCEEACPVDAIELTTLYDLTGLSREQMMFDKEKLLSVFDTTVKAGTDPVRTQAGRLGPASEAPPAPDGHSRSAPEA